MAGWSLIDETFVMAQSHERIFKIDVRRIQFNKTYSNSTLSNVNVLMKTGRRVPIMYSKRAFNLPNVFPFVDIRW